MVSHPENSSDSPIGSDRDRGRDKGRVYAITPPAESTDQPVIQGTFLLSRL